MTRHAHRTARERGLTLIELMVVLGIIALLSYLAVGAVRWLRGANAVETTVELTQVLNRTSQLAIETGVLHRVVFDLDQQTYRIEICQGGPAALSKTPDVAPGKPADAEAARKAALEAAKQKLSTVPQDALPTGGDSEHADDMALALAGDMASLRQCMVSTELFGDPDGKGTIRAVDTSRTAKIKQVFVQHLPDPVSTGLVAIYFFPLGSAEKAIVEIGDGSNKTFDVLVHGVTGRVEIHDGALPEPDDFMMRDATGEKTNLP